MGIYVALLRGINVGGNHKVPMAELKKVCEKLGFTDVRTYINSGNVIFNTSGSVAKIDATLEEALKKKFGFDVPVVVRTAAQLQKVANVIPAAWQNNTEYKTDALFLWEKFDSKTTIKKIAHDPKVDTLLYVPGAIVWHVKRKDYNKSGMHDLIGTEVYKHMTARNVNTVRILAGMVE